MAWAIAAQGRSQEVFFSLLGGANYINFYKNLIKIQICSVNLEIMGGQAPVRPPSLRPWPPLYLYSIA